MDPKIPAPLRPPWPLAKRLNRNALTVAAALAGVTVLTVVVVTNPSRSATDGNGTPAASAAGSAPPVPARPSFLDKPPEFARGAGVGSGVVTLAGVLALPPSTGRGAGAAGADIGPTDIGYPDGMGATSATAARNAAGPMSPVQSFHAALTSSVLVGDATHAGGSSGGGIGTTGTGDAAGVALHADTLAVPPVAPAREPTAAPAPVTASPPTSGGGPQSVVAVSHLVAAGSPYTVRAGTLIPGLLLTGVNSDLPGEVLGQMSRDVFDSRTQRILLVPKGSRLIGSYDSRSAGSGRLIVTWTRLILPDGRSLPLPRLAATDEQGQAGLHDQVDHHYGRIYGAALLTSALTAGVQLSQPQQSAVYAPPLSRQVAAGALGQSVGDVSLATAQRGLDLPPTLVIVRASRSTPFWRPTWRSTGRMWRRRKRRGCALSAWIYIADCIFSLGGQRLGVGGQGSGVRTTGGGTGEYGRPHLSAG